MANIKLPPPQKFLEDGEELENFLCTGGLKGKCETCYHWVTGHVGERWRVGGVVAFSATRERERERRGGWRSERARARRCTTLHSSFFQVEKCLEKCDVKERQLQRQTTLSNCGMNSSCSLACQKVCGTKQTISCVQQVQRSCHSSITTRHFCFYLAAWKTVVARIQG